jgi:hypothetical protein
LVPTLLEHARGRHQHTMLTRMRGLATRPRWIILSGSLVAFATLALVLTPMAAAVSAPTASAVEVTELTTSSAALKGTTYPGNEQTSYYFQYGTTSAYGAQTSLTPAGAGQQTLHVAVTITGLAAYTTYHCRLVAVNALGTTDGPDRTFVTKKIPLTFEIATIPSRSLFDSPFAISGILSGTGSANHAVVLQANPFPFLGGFKTLGNPELTEASGNFSFSIPGLTKNTQLRVATLETPPVNSRVVVALVAPRVTLHLRPAERPGYARLYGTITPGERGALVRFQFLPPGAKTKTVSSTIITSPGKAFSRFSEVVRIRHAGLYRVYVDVASGAQVPGHSRAILIG